LGAQPGGDPAAVTFSAIDAAVSRGTDVVIIDTVGRLHTSDGLMQELMKVARFIAKRLPEAPHESLLVLDGTIGQNAVMQAKTFAAAVPVTGIVVTKLDGTARGGVVVAVHEAIDVPVKFVGVGEKADDLVSFDASTFARDLLFHIPHRYEDASTVRRISSLRIGEDATVIGTVVSKGVLPTRKGLRIFQAVVQDASGLIEASWPGQPFLDRSIDKGDVLLLSGPVRFYHGRQLMVASV
jgi:hypothetical protein